MGRSPNTTVGGYGFDKVTIDQVWLKATNVPGYDPNSVRKDRCGALIQKSLYGSTDSKYGWEIDHQVPVARGGGDDLTNLQPLQWQNNRHKSDSFPQWHCAVSS